MFLMKRSWPLLSLLKPKRRESADFFRGDFGVKMIGSSPVVVELMEWRRRRFRRMKKSRQSTLVVSVATFQRVKKSSGNFNQRIFVSIGKEIYVVFTSYLHFRLVQLVPSEDLIYISKLALWYNLHELCVHVVVEINIGMDFFLSTRFQGLLTRYNFILKKKISLILGTHHRFKLSKSCHLWPMVADRRLLVTLRTRQ